MTADTGSRVEELKGSLPEPAPDMAPKSASASTEPSAPEEPWGEDLYDGEYAGDGIGCYNCSGGWHHTCCDDLCRNCNEAEDCEDGGRPCKLCNPDGEGST